MAKQIQHKRAIASVWTSINPILADGQLGIEKGTVRKFKIGDGVTAWNSLSYYGDQFEAAIVAGNANQYYRGDKTFQDFGTAVRSSALSGYSIGSNVAISASDTVLGAFGKLQAQVNAKFTNPMTTLGDIVYGGVGGAPTRLAGDTSNARRFLVSQSTGGAAAAPAWGALAAGDIPTGISITGQAGSVANNLTVSAELGGGTYNGGAAKTIAIQTNSVTNAMLQNMPALTIKGNNNVSAGVASDLTGAQVATMIPVFGAATKGLVPAPTTATNKFLRDDGTWQPATVTLYSTTGSNTDGAMTQAAVTAALNGKANTINQAYIVLAFNNPITTWAFSASNPNASLQTSADTSINITGTADGDSGVLRLIKQNASHVVTFASGNLTGSVEDTTNAQYFYFINEAGVIKWFAEAPLLLTTTGSGAATWNPVTRVLNIPTASAGTGDVTLATEQTFTANKFFGTGTGITFFATADQVTNYERLKIAYNAASTRWEMLSEKGGTGTRRTFRVGNSAAYLEFNDNATVGIGGSLSFSGSDISGAGGIMAYNFNGLNFRTGAANNLSTGIFNFHNIVPNINQSGTAGYTAARVSVYEQAVGTGEKTLLDLGTNSAANGGGTHTSRFRVTTAGAVYAPALTNATTANVLYIDTATGLITYGAAGGGSIADNSVTNAKLAQMAAGTVKANITGGAANAADVTLADFTAQLPTFTTTAKGLVPVASGGSETTQFLRKDGTWATPAGGGGSSSADYNVTTEYAQTTNPTTPTSGVTMFARDRAGRVSLAYKNDGAYINEIQSAIFQKHVAWLTAYSGTINIVGTTSGGQASSNEGNTSYGATFIERMPRTTWTTTATAGTSVSLRYPIGMVYRNTANTTHGGFFFFTRFGVAAMGGADMIMAAGLWNQGVTTTLAGTENLSSKTAFQMIMVGKDAADTNWQIMHSSGGGSVTKVDTGIAVTASSTAYELSIHSPAGDTNVYVTLRDMNGNTVFSTTLSTNLPSNNTLLNYYIGIANNATAAVSRMALNIAYTEVQHQGTV